MGEGIRMRGWNLIEGRETREKIVRIECSLGSKSINIRKCYSILFYHFKKPLYYLYHTILQYLQHPKTLFLLKYYFFNLFLLFLSNRHFFFRLGFRGLSNSHFISPLSPSTSSTGSTHKATHTSRPMIHRSTYPNPSPHTQSHTHTQKHKPSN